MPRPRALALLCLLALAGCRGSPPLDLLLLISVDTLRADHLGAYGDTRGLTPHLDALARQSQVFDAAYAPAPFTLPSVAALLTGRYPESLGVLSNVSRLPDGTPTLATELQRRGWRTAAVVSNLALGRKAGLAAGFERYDDDLPQREAVRQWPERVAAATTDAALAALDERIGPGRIFLWVHYVDPHGPYTPPAGYRERYLEAERQRFDGARELPVGARGGDGLSALPTYQFVEGVRDVGFYRAGYAGEVDYVDAEIGRLLEGVRSRGLAERSLVVFTADHGESLGEDELWFDHRDFLSDALVRVPLLVRRPGAAPGRRADVASLVDLYPSLLKLLEDAAPGASHPGRDLLAPRAARATGRSYLASLRGGRRTRIGLVEDRDKLVITRERDGDWRRQLFRRGEDRVDRAGVFAERAAALEATLKSLRREVAVRDERRQELGEEERARLRALGYAVDVDADAAAKNAGEEPPTRRSPDSGKR